MNKVDASLEYTGPSDRGRCGFCGGVEGGYAKQDACGTWKAACWECVKPVPLPPQKRQHVGTIFTEDLDAEDKIQKRAKGLAPSTHRPKTL
jgi:hypothetical protein